MSAVALWEILVLPALALGTIADQRPPMQQLAVSARGSPTEIVRARSYPWARLARSDSLEIIGVDFGPARVGRNPFRATIRNAGTSVVMALLDLRAVPGMWMIPNNQVQFQLELAPGATGVIEGFYHFQRLSREATLRVMIGTGSLRENGYYSFDRVELRETYHVGRNNPDAYQPAEYFNLTRRGPLEIYSWRGSLADGQVETIGAQRLRAMQSIAELLAVEPPEHVRLVFYADEATKVEQTGHQGAGWARGTTIVEVYNEEVQLDPFHELVHVVSIPAGSPPAALREGLAVYVSELLGADALGFLGMPDTTLDHATCLLLGTDYLPLSKLLALDNIGNTAERAPYEYAQAGALVKFLIDHGGWDRFRALYSGTSEDAELMDNVRVLEGVYGRTRGQLEQDWLEMAALECAAL